MGQVAFALLLLVSLGPLFLIHSCCWRELLCVMVLILGVGVLCRCVHVLWWVWVSVVVLVYCCWALLQAHPWCCPLGTYTAIAIPAQVGSRCSCWIFVNLIVIMCFPLPWLLEPLVFCSSIASVLQFHCTWVSLDLNISWKVFWVVDVMLTRFCCCTSHSCCFTSFCSLMASSWASKAFFILLTYASSSHVSVVVVIWVLFLSSSSTMFWVVVFVFFLGVCLLHSGMGT